MKTITFSLLILLIVFLAGCTEESKVPKQTPQTNNQQTNTNKTDTLKKTAPTGTRMDISVPDSKIEWFAKKVTGSHHGTIKLGRGELFVDNYVLKGGNFAVDMQTIEVLEMDNADMKAKLTNDLKSDNFFAVDKNPIGRFYFSSATPITDDLGNNYMIKGEMMLKNIKHDISFPAKVTIESGKVTATADIVIDRTLFDIKYRSGKFFEKLGDNLIYDDFTIKIFLTTK